VTHFRLAFFLIGLFLAAGAWSAHAESGIAPVYSGRDTASGERKNSGAPTEAGKKNQGTAASTKLASYP
jgi:hypothetical protein